MSEIYIEFARSGKVTKVTAIDPESGTEVSTVCPSGLTKQQMQMMAVKKLKYIIQRDKKTSDNNVTPNIMGCDTIV